MELLVNELSLHAQFHDTSLFRNALARLMVMRCTAKRYGREVHCNRLFTTRDVTPGVTIHQAVSRLPEAQRRSVMSWLASRGPFWDDIRLHRPNDYLECRGEIVTDSAVGEAAHRRLYGIDCGLISVTPSDWDYSPVTVISRREDEAKDNGVRT